MISVDVFITPFVLFLYIGMCLLSLRFRFVLRALPLAVLTIFYLLGLRKSPAL